MKRCVCCRNVIAERIRNEYACSLRSFPVNSYMIFYRILETGIEIVRVLHCARDFDSILEPEDFHFL
ncbi:MAG: type II toxin-antitoxin system RelE/ParE family toxin [Candidatus Omnitrophota bacterium]|nr:MAG: type II toxin-antitoxin system RelE/ParE family toxin [Candidatus Omnitrophota bacterium]